jgi:hypothetical protein
MLLFWGASLCLFCELLGWDVVSTWWASLVPAAQAAFVALAVTMVMLTGMLLEQLTVSIAQLAAGQWRRPFLGLARKFRDRRQKGLASKQQRFSQLLLKEVLAQPTQPAPEERAEAARLDAELAHRPADPAQSMPTALGDVLRAATEYPRRRYGLDPSVTWPRLYPVLSETLRGALSGARGNMDALLRAAALSVAFGLVWGVWLFVARRYLLAALVAAGGVLLALLSYSGALQAGATYGTLLRTAFDLHRFDLYKALHWPLPLHWHDEKPAAPGQPNTQGQLLTQFLHRGLGVPDVEYEHPKDPGAKAA